MTPIVVLFFSILFGSFVYVWNKYVIPKFVKRVVAMNPENNWLDRNQYKIVSGFQWFYRTGLILAVFSMLYSLIFNY